MINESKVRLMTKAAMIKQKEERNAFRVTRYDGYDYISFQTIKGIIGMTFSYILILVLWALSCSDELLTEYSIKTLIRMAQGLIILYFLLLVVTIMICVLVYSSKYWTSRHRMKGYRSSVRKLNRMYQKEAKDQEAKNQAAKDQAAKDQASKNQEEKDQEEKDRQDSSDIPPGAGDVDENADQDAKEQSEEENRRA